jgi:hypothetical protein
LVIQLWAWTLAVRRTQVAISAAKEDAFNMDFISIENLPRELSLTFPFLRSPVNIINVRIALSLGEWNKLKESPEARVLSVEPFDPAAIRVNSCNSRLSRA